MAHGVVYIAGPMSGLPDYGRKAFAEAEVYLRSMGWRVLNPACLPTDLPGTVYMPICLAMLQQAGTVAMMLGWESSRGAKMEHEFAKMCGKDVFYMQTRFGEEKRK